MLPTSRTATLVVNPFVAAVLYALSLVIGRVVAQDVPHPSTPALAHSSVVPYDGPILLVAGAVTIGSLIFALVWALRYAQKYEKQLTWTMNLGANDWSTVGTWVAQFGVLSGAFTAIVVQQPSLLPSAAQEPTHFVALAVLFGATAVVAPLLYALTCIPTVPGTALAGDPAAPQGWTLSFIASFGLILFAALGQLGLGFAYIATMQAIGTLFNAVAILLLCLIGLGYIVICAAVVRTTRLYLDELATNALAEQDATGKVGVSSGKKAPTPTLNPAQDSVE